MIPEENCPLAGRGNFRGLPQHFGNRVPILLPERHEDPRHQWEVETHLTLVPVTKEFPHIGRPLVGLGQQEPVRIPFLQDAAELLQDSVCFRQIFVNRAFSFAQIWHRVEAERIDPAVEPEGHHLQHGLEHSRVVVVQIRLMREEAVPVVLASHRVERPVRHLCIREDDARAGIPPVVVAPDVEVALRGVAGRQRAAWNHGC